MDRNIESYVKTFKNIIPKELSENCLIELTNQTYTENYFTDPITGESHNETSNEPWVVDSYVNDNLNKIIWQCIFDYVTSLKFSWFSGWAGYRYPRVNKYEINQEMAPHCDRIKSMFDGERKGDPTLTVLGQFQGEYEGGDLIMFEDQKFKFDPLDIIIFPSTFLFPHYITPVTSGTRISFVSWVW